MKFHLFPLHVRDSPQLLRDNEVDYLHRDQYLYDLQMELDAGLCFLVATGSLVQLN